MRKILFVAGVSLFAGLVIGYNLFLNDYNYAIVYFGNAMVTSGKTQNLFPRIKLMKKEKTNHGPFYWGDPGKEVKITDIIMGASIVEIEDKEIDKFIKAKYCK